MDYVVLLLFIFCSSCVLLVYLKSWRSYNHFSSAKLPPGPKPLPIFGNIFQLGEKPYQSITALSKTYGPLMCLKLGSVTTIVISSSDIAREIFQNHDIAFSNKRVNDVVRACNHHKHSIAWSPASPLWRDSRKIISIQLFSTCRLNETSCLREKKVTDLLEYVRSCSRKGELVDIGHAAFTTALNSLSNTFFSCDLAHYIDDLSQEFKQLIWEVMRSLGRPNLADYFPIIRHLDPQGARRRATFHFSKLLDVFDRIIKQRLIDYPPLSSSSNGDVLDALLDMRRENGSQVNLEYIRHLLFDMFIAGTDTIAGTLEWAMTELMRNPTKLEKAQTEIDLVLGKKMELVQESDIVSKLPYLEAIIKETLRLHPPAPILLPRETITDVNTRGYLVPKGTQVLVNVWAIGRDPDVWGPNSDSFFPERFLGCGNDINRGLDHFELMPFGAGRRICPGLPLANRMLHLMLANLIHSFNWKLPDGMHPGQLDMTEKLGITLQKLRPLQAVPISK